LFTNDALLHSSKNGLLIHYNSNAKQSAQCRKRYNKNIYTIYLDNHLGNNNKQYPGEVNIFEVHRFNLTSKNNNKKKTKEKTVWNVLTNEKAQFIPSKVWQRSASVRIAIVPFEEVDGAALLFCHPSNVASTPIFK
ncbi:hypothetical protein T12_12902, partial [Trichinella patagoniensis]